MEHWKALSQAGAVSQTAAEAVADFERDPLPLGLAKAADGKIAAAGAAATRTRVLPIHPAFRVVALAAEPSAREPWLAPETLAMFDFHSAPASLDASEVRVVLWLQLRCPRRTCSLTLGHAPPSFVR